MTSAPRRFPAGSMRVSDADRDRALAELTEHYQAGRLDTEEFNDRSGRALQARTGQELTGLFTDLPQDQPALVDPALAPTRIGRSRVTSWPTATDLAPVIRAVAAVAAVAVIVTAVAVGRPGHFWGGFLGPLLLILLIVRRFTRGRR
ncbi:MAG TPA: DUF1707 domain-containing protein [Streptosporangiaceae bacterium]|nr:DUF1707 domain-containing protein [Streptosporangiaceae bacterium]